MRGEASKSMAVTRGSWVTVVDAHKESGRGVETQTDKTQLDSARTEGEDTRRRGGGTSCQPAQVGVSAQMKRPAWCECAYGKEKEVRTGGGGGRGGWPRQPRGEEPYLQEHHDDRCGEDNGAARA